MEEKHEIILLAVVGIALTWKLVCIWLRSKRSRLIASISPVENVQLVRRITENVEFPFLAQTALEFALFRTYAIPSISKTLYKAGAFEASAVKRADDTEILLREATLHHVDSDRGSLAIKRLNFIHSHYKISNEDYLYVLSVFISEPQRWVQRYGYRDMTRAERVAEFVIWRDLGVRMGIRDIPSTYEELEKMQFEYEKAHMVYADSNRKIADMTVNLFLSRLPRVMWPLARRLIYAMLDDRLSKAFGYPQQPVWLQALVRVVLKFCTGTFVSVCLPPRPFAWAVDRITVDKNDQGERFNPEQLRKLAFSQFPGSPYDKGYKITEVGAHTPGQLGTTGSGSLLCPLQSSYFTAPWPPK